MNCNQNGAGFTAFRIPNRYGTLKVGCTQFSKSRRIRPRPPPLPEDAKLVQTMQCAICNLPNQWILESRMKPIVYELDCQYCGRYLVPTPPRQCKSRSRSPECHDSDKFMRSPAPSPIRQRSSSRIFGTPAPLPIRQIRKSAAKIRPQPESKTRLLLLAARAKKEQRNQ